MQAYEHGIVWTRGRKAGVSRIGYNVSCWPEADAYWDGTISPRAYAAFTTCCLPGPAGSTCGTALEPKSQMELSAP
jgi:hypothetical protein